jgi:hypothetical protein
LTPPEEARTKLREYIGALKQRELDAKKQAETAVLAALEEEGSLTEEHLAAAVEALRTGAPAPTAEDMSPVAALLRDTEIGLRLHQDSKMGEDEEGWRPIGEEKVENG